MHQLGERALGDEARREKLADLLFELDVDGRAFARRRHETARAIHVAPMVRALSVSQRPMWGRPGLGVHAPAAVSPRAALAGCRPRPSARRRRSVRPWAE